MSALGRQHKNLALKKTTPFSFVKMSSLGEVILQSMVTFFHGFGSEQKAKSRELFASFPPSNRNGRGVVLEDGEMGSSADEF